MAIGLHRASAEVPDVRYSTRLGRRGIVVIAIVALAAGTAAASRWTPWSPLNSCLFCGSTAAPATSMKTTNADAVAPGMMRARDTAAAGARAGGSAGDSALLAPGSSARAGAGQGRVAMDDSRHDWQPWSTPLSTRVNGGDNTTLLGGF